MRTTQLDLPPACLPDEEKNPFLRRVKALLQKRWTFTRMEALFEEVDLAYYLFALARHDESLQVLTFLTGNVAFDGDYNRWTPIGFALCLQARHYRTHADESERIATLLRIHQHPFQVVRREDVAQWIDSMPTLTDEAYNTGSQKWACLKLSRLLYKACFFRETREAEYFAHSGWYSAEKMETFVIDGFEKLRVRLQDK